MLALFVIGFVLFKSSLSQQCITSSTTTTTVATPTCPTGWSTFQSACYIYVSGGTAGVPATTAINGCQAMGAHLVSIHSSAEYNFVQNLGGSSIPIWIGAVRTGTVDSDTNFSNIDGTPFDFSNWDTFEPNNTNSWEYCVCTRPNSQWDDFNCANTISFGVGIGRIGCNAKTPQPLEDDKVNCISVNRP